MRNRPTLINAQQRTAYNSKLVNTVKALYNYWVAANAYFRG